MNNSFFFLVPHRKGFLGFLSRGTHYGIYLSSLFWMFGNPLVPWQISLPWVQVQVHCPSSPWQNMCSASFCSSPCGMKEHFMQHHRLEGSSQTPTWGTCPEKAPSLPSSLTLYRIFPSLWPILRPLRPSPCALHSARSKGWNN